MTYPTICKPSCTELVVPAGIVLPHDRVDRRPTHAPVQLQVVGVGRQLSELHPRHAAATHSAASALLESSLEAIDEAEESLDRRAEIFDLHGASPWISRVSTGSVGPSAVRSSGTRKWSDSARGVRCRVAAALFAAFSVLLVLPASAQVPFAPNVFADALINGRSTAPVTARSDQQSKVLARLQAISGSSEPVSIIAARIFRFSQQPHCGRVQFAFGQPKAHVVFKSPAGQMNICDDGQPPLRVCADHPGVLVPVAASCGNGTLPIDTDEVASAIRSAGGMTHEEMLRAWAHHIASNARAASAAGSASHVQAGSLKGLK